MYEKTDQKGDEDRRYSGVKVGPKNEEKGESYKKWGRGCENGWKNQRVN